MVCLSGMEHISRTSNILVAVLAITFCWCHISGEWLHQQKPIKIKKHGRPAVSIFRYGLDWIREIVLNLSENKLQQLGWCLNPVSDYDSRKIRSLRDRYKISQAVLASLLKYQHLCRTPMGDWKQAPKRSIPETSLPAGT